MSPFTTDTNVDNERRHDYLEVGPLAGSSDLSNETERLCKVGTVMPWKQVWPTTPLNQADVIQMSNLPSPRNFRPRHATRTNRFYHNSQNKALKSGRNLPTSTSRVRHSVQPEGGPHKSSTHLMKRPRGYGANVYIYVAFEE